MTKFQYTDDQNRVAGEFTKFLLDPKEEFFVIQGAAGTGKSFMIKNLAETFYSKIKARSILSGEKLPRISDICFTASTHKAAAVLRDFLFGKERIPLDIPLPSVVENARDIFATALTVRTLHSALSLKLINDRKTGKTVIKSTNSPVILRNTLLFVDEASFIDDQLFGFLKEHTINCKIVLVGDYYQLAPVGRTKTIMQELDCSRVEMTEVVRNGGNILTTSHAFRNAVAKCRNILPTIDFDGTEVVCVDGKEFKKLITKEFTALDWNPDKSRILAWTNSRVQEYNKFIRELNKLPEHFVSGEKVVTNRPIVSTSVVHQIDSIVEITDVVPVTDPAAHRGIAGVLVEVNNGFVGFLPHSFREEKELLKELARNKEWAKYFSIKENWLDLRSTYACSVHKAQGATFDKVFIDLTDIGRNWVSSEVARLMYVAISRGAKQVICHGSLQ